MDALCFSMVTGVVAVTASRLLLAGRRLVRVIKPARSAVVIAAAGGSIATIATPAASRGGVAHGHGVPQGAFDDVGEDIIDYFRTAGEDLDPLHLAAPPVSDLVRECKRVLPRRNSRLECVPVLLRLYEAHGLSRERLPSELADRWLGVTMDGAATDLYRQHLLKRMKWVRVSHPDWLK